MFFHRFELSTFLADDVWQNDSPERWKSALFYHFVSFFWLRFIGTTHFLGKKRKEGRAYFNLLSPSCSWMESLDIRRRRCRTRVLTRAHEGRIPLPLYVLEGKGRNIGKPQIHGQKKDGKGISIFLHPSPKRTSRVPSPAISLDEKLYRSLRTTQTPHVIRALRTHHEERISGRFFFVYRLWLCLVRACVRTMNPRLKTIGINPEKHASYGAGSGWVWCVPRNVLFIIFLSVSSSCPRGRRNTPKNARSR